MMLWQPPRWLVGATRAVCTLRPPPPPADPCNDQRVCSNLFKAVCCSSCRHFTIRTHDKALRTTKTHLNSKSVKHGILRQPTTLYASRLWPVHRALDMAFVLQHKGLSRRDQWGQLGFPPPRRRRCRPPSGPPCWSRRSAWAGRRCRGASGRAASCAARGPGP